MSLHVLYSSVTAGTITSYSKSIESFSSLQFSGAEWRLSLLKIAKLTKKELRAAAIGMIKAKATQKFAPAHTGYSERQIKRIKKQFEETGTLSDLSKGRQRPAIQSDARRDQRI